jgi:hypothetical protein
LRYANTVKTSVVPDNIKEINEMLSASETFALSVCEDKEAIRAKYRRVRNYSMKRLLKQSFLERL